MTETTSRLLTETEAAEELSISPTTLSTWRSTNRYPLPFVRVGRRVRYRREDLAAFLRSRTFGGDPTEEP
ncbi:MAG TPA: helix-turn-helix domain-containing protein [Thermoanaerobaculaceae bacterium]|nr:helix-turn-helix domain-containing protein [Thermoanaerobaculaceae bacterium]